MKIRSENQRNKEILKGLKAILEKFNSFGLENLYDKVMTGNGGTLMLAMEGCCDTSNPLLFLKKGVKKADVSKLDRELKKLVKLGKKEDIKAQMDLDKKNEAKLKKELKKSSKKAPKQVSLRNPDA